MMTLPHFSSLSTKTVLWAGIGYLCGMAFKADPKKFALICAISEIAETLIFLVATLKSNDDQEIKATYAVVNAFVNTITVFALFRLKLIARPGVFLLTSSTIINFFSKIIEVNS